MCLISTSEDGRLQVEKDALEQITKIDAPLLVVAIAGLYRTGKSYLMNCLAGETPGCALRSSNESRKKGVWIWCREHPTKKETVLLLLDTDGNGDVKKVDNRHDNRILTITTLLSNVFVYNIMTAFNQDAVEKLNFITEMSKYIRFDKFEENAGDEQLGLVFPQFVLCVRDLSLVLEKDGMEITPDEYLEDCLQLKTGNDNERYNRPRECIRKYFPTRKCFVFDRLGDREVMKSLESVPSRNEDEALFEETERFLNHIYTCEAKMPLSIKSFNGPMFVSLVESYINALRKGTILDVDDAITVVANIENERMENEAVEHFKERVKNIELQNLNKCQLEDLYHDMQKTALDRLRFGSVFNSEKFEQSAKEKMNKIWEETKKKNVQFPEVRKLYTGTISKIKINVGKKAKQVISHFMDTEDENEKEIMMMDQGMTEEKRQKHASNSSIKGIAEPVEQLEKRNAKEDLNSTVSDTWSTDVFAIDSEPPDIMGQHLFFERASEISETANNAWSTDVLASDNEEKQAETFSEFDDMSSMAETASNLDDVRSHCDATEGNEVNPLASDWMTCIQSSNKEIADELLNSKQLPDMNTLNELCHKFRRKSETTIKVCEEVCHYIQGLSQQIVDVYPSRKAVVLKQIDGKEEKFEIKFVVVTENMNEVERKELETLINKTYDTLPVRDSNQLSCEETDLQKKLDYELKGEALNTVKSCLRQNTGTLLNKHKYLSIVSGCPYKSIGYGTTTHRIEETPCIVLNVPYKGYIPIDEDPFEKSYNGVQTDVREDVFVLFGGTATARHDNLMAGCLISGELDENRHCAKGTLGGFLVHPEYGLCGISCSHAVLMPSELKSMSNRDGEINWECPSSLLVNSEEKSERYVYQPMKDDDIDNKIGRLVKVRYCKGIEGSQDLDAYGMDVAIFQLSNRLPESSKFPDVKVSGSEDKNREIPVQFGKGDVEGFTWLDENRYSKYGATTGYTTTNLSINSTVHVKPPHRRHYKDKTKNVQFEFILHNQVCFGNNKKGGRDIIPFDIKSDENKNKWFAYKGDSGALVYREASDDDLLCVGMVVGGRQSEKTCIVTPIIPILKEMGIANFKNFDSEQMENSVKTLVTKVKSMDEKLDKVVEIVSRPNNCILQ